MKKIGLSMMVLFVIFLTGCAMDASMDQNITDNWTPDYSMDGESYAEIQEQPFISVNDMPVSTFSADVDTASYSNVRRMLHDNQTVNKDAVRIEELVNYFDYDLNGPNENEAVGITTEYAVAPWNENHNLLMIGLKTQEIDFTDTAGNNLVFLLDVSGSMTAANKLPLLQSAMKLLVNQLRPQDRISIVVYAGAAGVVLDGADGGEQQEIIDAIDSLTAGGSTAGAQGIHLAYEVAMEHFIVGGNNRVILGTDGDFNVGVSSNEGLENLIEEKRESGVFFSVLGFGTGNLQDDKMETLADQGNGVYYYIDSILEAKKVFINELGASLITVAKDVKLQVEFNPASVAGYRLIGYENRTLNYDDFNNDEVDAGDMGAGHEVIAFYEIIPAGSNEDITPIESQDIPENLKYDDETLTDEIMTLSIRYKHPENDTSELIQHTVYVTDETTSPSNTFEFASAVVEFGLLLRDSDYKGNANYNQLYSRAEAAIGEDEHGYRTEFLTLVTIAKAID